MTEQGRLRGTEEEGEDTDERRGGGREDWWRMERRIKVGGNERNRGRKGKVEKGEEEQNKWWREEKGECRR